MIIGIVIFVVIATTDVWWGLLKLMIFGVPKDGTDEGVVEKPNDT